MDERCGRSFSRVRTAGVVVPHANVLHTKVKGEEVEAHPRLIPNTNTHSSGDCALLAAQNGFDQRPNVRFRRTSLPKCFIVITFPSTVHQNNSAFPYPDPGTATARSYWGKGRALPYEAQKRHR